MTLGVTNLAVSLLACLNIGIDYFSNIPVSVLVNKSVLRFNTLLVANLCLQTLLRLLKHFLKS